MCLIISGVSLAANPAPKAASLRPDPLIDIGIPEMQSPDIKAILQKFGPARSRRIKLLTDFSDDESLGHPSPKSPLPALSPRFLAK